MAANTKAVMNPSVPVIRGDIVAIDLETNGLNPLENEVLAIAIKTRDEHYVLDTSHYSKQDIVEQLDKLKQFDAVIAHNAKFDASFLYHQYGLVLDNWYCSMIASQIIYNGKDDPPLTLIEVVKDQLGIDLITQSNKTVLQHSFIGRKFGNPLTEKQLEYAGDDVLYLLDVYERQTARIKRAGLEKVLRLERTLLPVIVKMEVGGCLVDRDQWLKLIDSWVRKRLDIVNELDDELIRLSSVYKQLDNKFYAAKRNFGVVSQFDLFGQPKTQEVESHGRINYSAAGQIIGIFKVLSLPLPLNKEGRESVDESTLDTYVTENPLSPLSYFIDKLIELREYEKLISTYGQKFLSKLDSNGYIHTKYTQCRTKTGRLSSHSPNLQNIPANELRQCFIAPPGKVLITCDMEAAEVRIAADYSQEPLLIQSLLEGADMHSKLASVSFSIIFGEPITISKSKEPITIKGHTFIPNELRDAHKRVLFAKFYKAGARRVYQVLARYINNFHPVEDRLTIAGAISTALDAEMPVLTRYLTNVIDTVRKQGFVRGSKLGRIRYFPDGGYGEAANMPIQNTNGEAMKIAMIKADKFLTESGCGRVILSVHDELVAEVDEDKAETVKFVIQKIMADALGWFLKTVPGGSSVKVGKFWNK